MFICLKVFLLEDGFMRDEIVVKVEDYEEEGICVLEWCGLCEICQ